MKDTVKYWKWTECLQSRLETVHRRRVANGARPTVLCIRFTRLLMARCGIIFFNSCYVILFGI